MKKIIQPVALASTLLVVGCATEADLRRAEYYRRIDAQNESGPSFQKDINSVAGIFGPLLGAQSNAQAQRGDFRNANINYAASGIVQNQYNRQTAIDAAREGRSQVNINVAPRNNSPSEYKDIRLFDWIDSDNDKRLNPKKDYYKASEDNLFGPRSIVVLSLSRGRFAGQSCRVEFCDTKGAVVDEKKFFVERVADVSRDAYQDGMYIPISYMNEYLADGSKKKPTGTQEYYFKVFTGNDSAPSGVERLTINFDRPY